MEKSLADLKAENAAAEAAPEQETVIAQEEQPIEAAEVEAEEVEQIAESEQPEAEETEVEAWMVNEEEQTSEAKFTDHDVANVRRKLKGKIEKKDHELEQKNGEIAQLKQELEAVKQAVLMGGDLPSKKPEPLAVPTLEAFDYDDQKYQQAMMQWTNQQIQSQIAQVTDEGAMQHKQMQAQQALESKVNSHYERAGKLAQENNISSDAYQAADMAVRQTIESVMPNAGDRVTDELIANLGDGSEKVMYYLGRNPSAQLELRNKLMQDPNGLQASMYLGELKSKVSLPKKQKSKAPAPAPSMESERGTSNADETKFLRRYEKANDISERMAIRREMSAAGLDTKVLNN